MSSPVIPVVSALIEAVLAPICLNLESSRTTGALEWQGLELDPLLLSKGHFGEPLPFNIVVGSIGLLSISIPWSAIITMPANSVSLTLRDVYIVLEPNFDWEPQTLVETELALRSAAVNRLVQSLLEQVEAAPAEEAQTFSWRDLRSSFTKSIMSQIFSSLKVDVTNIHIRLDWPRTGTTGFSVGVSMPIASLQTPRLPDQSGSTKEFQCFLGVYVETASQNSRRVTISREDYHDVLRDRSSRLLEDFHDGGRSGANESHILKPLMIKGMLFSPCLKTSAEIGLYCELPDVELCLYPSTVQQASLVTSFVQNFREFKKTHTYYKPLLKAALPPPKQRPTLAPFLWWKWAVEAIKHLKQAENMLLNWTSPPAVTLLRRHAEYVAAAHTLFISQKLERLAKKFIHRDAPSSGSNSNQVSVLRERLQGWDQDLTLPLEVLLIWRRQAAADKTLNINDLQRLRLLWSRDAAIDELRTLVKRVQTDFSQLTSALKSSATYLSPSTARDNWKALRGAGGNVSRTLGRWLLGDLKEESEEVSQEPEEVPDHPFFLSFSLATVRLSLGVPAADSGRAEFEDGKLNTTQTHLLVSLSHADLHLSIRRPPESREAYSRVSLLSVGKAYIGPPSKGQRSIVDVFARGCFLLSDVELAKIETLDLTGDLVYVKDAIIANSMAQFGLRESPSVSATGQANDVVDYRPFLTVEEDKERIRASLGHIVCHINPYIMGRLAPFLSAAKTAQFTCDHWTHLHPLFPTSPPTAPPKAASGEEFRVEILSPTLTWVVSSPVLASLHGRGGVTVPSRPLGSEFLSRCLSPRMTSACTSGHAREVDLTVNFLQARAVTTNFRVAEVSVRTHLHVWSFLVDYLTRLGFEGDESVQDDPGFWADLNHVLSLFHRYPAFCRISLQAHHTISTPEAADKAGSTSFSIDNTQLSRASSVISLMEPSPGQVLTNSLKSLGDTSPERDSHKIAAAEALERFEVEIDKDLKDSNLNDDPLVDLQSEVLTATGVSVDFDYLVNCPLDELNYNVWCSVDSIRLIASFPSVRTVYSLWTAWSRVLRRPHWPGFLDSYLLRFRAASFTDSLIVDQESFLLQYFSPLLNPAHDVLDILESVDVYSALACAPVTALIPMTPTPPLCQFSGHLERIVRVPQDLVLAMNALDLESILMADVVQSAFGDHVDFPLLDHSFQFHVHRRGVSAAKVGVLLNSLWLCRQSAEPLLVIQPSSVLALSASALVISAEVVFNPNLVDLNPILFTEPEAGTSSPPAGNWISVQFGEETRVLSNPTGPFKYSPGDAFLFLIHTAAASPILTPTRPRSDECFMEAFNQTRSHVRSPSEEMLGTLRIANCLVPLELRQRHYQPKNFVVVPRNAATWSWGAHLRFELANLEAIAASAPSKPGLRLVIQNLKGDVVDRPGGCGKGLVTVADVDLYDISQKQLLILTKGAPRKRHKGSTRRQTDYWTLLEERLLVASDFCTCSIDMQSREVVLLIKPTLIRLCPEVVQSVSVLLGSFQVLLDQISDNEAPWVSPVVEPEVRHVIHSRVTSGSPSEFASRLLIGGFHIRLLQSHTETVIVSIDIRSIRMCKYPGRASLEVKSVSLSLATQHEAGRAPLGASSEAFFAIDYAWRSERLTKLSADLRESSPLDCELRVSSSHSSFEWRTAEILLVHDFIRDIQSAVEPLMKVTSAVSGDKVRFWRGVVKAAEHGRLVEDMASLTSLWLTDEEPKGWGSRDFSASILRGNSRSRNDLEEPFLGRPVKTEKTEKRRKPVLWLDVHVRLPQVLMVDPVSAVPMIFDLGTLVVDTTVLTTASPTAVWSVGFQGFQLYGQRAAGRNGARMKLSSPLICDCVCQQALLTSHDDHLLRPPELTTQLSRHREAVGVFVKFKVKPWELTLHPGVFLYLSRNYRATCDVPRTPQLDSLLLQTDVTSQVAVSPSIATAFEPTNVSWTLREIASSKGDSWSFCGDIDGLEISVVDSSNEIVFKSETRDIKCVMSRDWLRVRVQYAVVVEGVSSDTMRPIFRCVKESDELPDILFTTEPVVQANRHLSYVLTSAKQSRLVLQEPWVCLHPKVVACAKLLLYQNVQQIVDPIGTKEAVDLPLMWSSALRLLPAEANVSTALSTPFLKSVDLNLNMLRKHFRELVMSDAYAAPLPDDMPLELISLEAILKLLKCPLAVSLDSSTRVHVVKHSFEFHVTKCDLRLSIPGADDEESGVYMYHFSADVIASRTTATVRTVIASDIEDAVLSGHIDCGVNMKVKVDSGQAQFCPASAPSRNVMGDFSLDLAVSQGHMLTQKLLAYLSEEADVCLVTAGPELKTMTQFLDDNCVLPFFSLQGSLSDVMFTVTDADIVRATQAVFWIEGSQPDRFSRSIHHRPVLQATSQIYGHVLPVTNEQSTLTTAFHFPSCCYNNERVLSVGNDKALLTGVRVRPAPSRRTLTHIQLNAGSAHLMYYRQERTANPLLRIKSESSSFACRTDVSDGQPGTTRSFVDLDATVASYDAETGRWSTLVSPIDISFSVRNSEHYACVFRSHAHVQLSNSTLRAVLFHFDEMRSAYREASDRSRLARHEFDRVYRRRFSRVTDRSKRLRAAPASMTRIRSSLVALERLAAAWNQQPNESMVEVDSADVVVIVTNRSSGAVYIRLRQQQSRVADWFYLRPFAHVGLTHTVVAKYLLTKVDFVEFHSDAACLTSNPCTLRMPGNPHPKLGDIRHCIRNVVRNVDLTAPLNLTPLGAAHTSVAPPAKPSSRKVWDCCAPYCDTSSEFVAPQSFVTLEGMVLGRYASRVRQPLFFKLSSPVIIRNHTDLALSLIAGSFSLELVPGSEIDLPSSLTAFTLLHNACESLPIQIPAVADPLNPKSYSRSEHITVAMSNLAVSVIISRLARRTRFQSVATVHTTLIVCSPITLRNCLPVALEISVANDEAVSTSHPLKMSPLSTKCTYGVVADGAVYARVKMVGTEWSDAFLLSTGICTGKDGACELRQFNSVVGNISGTTNRISLLFNTATNLARPTTLQESFSLNELPVFSPLCTAVFAPMWLLLRAPMQVSFSVGDFIPLTGECGTSVVPFLVGPSEEELFVGTLGQPADESTAAQSEFRVSNFCCAAEELPPVVPPLTPEDSPGSTDWLIQPFQMRFSPRFLEFSGKQEMDHLVWTSLGSVNSLLAAEGVLYLHLDGVDLVWSKELVWRFNEEETHWINTLLKRNSPSSPSNLTHVSAEPGCVSWASSPNDPWMLAGNWRRPPALIPPYPEKHNDDLPMAGPVSHHASTMSTPEAHVVEVFPRFYISNRSNAGVELVVLRGRNLDIPTHISTDTLAPSESKVLRVPSTRTYSVLPEQELLCSDCIPMLFLRHEPQTARIATKMDQPLSQRTLDSSSDEAWSSTSGVTAAPTVDVGPPVVWTDPIPFSCYTEPLLRSNGTCSVCGKSVEAAGSPAKSLLASQVWPDKGTEGSSPFPVWQAVIRSLLSTLASDGRRLVRRWIRPVVNARGHILTHLAVVQSTHPSTHIHHFDILNLDHPHVILENHLSNHSVGVKICLPPGPWKARQMSVSVPPASSRPLWLTSEALLALATAGAKTEKPATFKCFSRTAAPTPAPAVVYVRVEPDGRWHEFTAGGLAGFSRFLNKDTTHNVFGQRLQTHSLVLYYSTPTVGLKRTQLTEIDFGFREKQTSKLVLDVVSRKITLGLFSKDMPLISIQLDNVRCRLLTMPPREPQFSEGWFTRNRFKVDLAVRSFQTDLHSSLQEECTPIIACDSAGTSQHVLAISLTGRYIDDLGQFFQHSDFPAMPELMLVSGWVIDRASTSIARLKVALPLCAVVPRLLEFAENLPAVKLVSEPRGARLIEIPDLNTPTVHPDTVVVIESSIGQINCLLTVDCANLNTVLLPLLAHFEASTAEQEAARLVQRLLLSLISTQSPVRLTAKTTQQLLSRSCPAELKTYLSNRRRHLRFQRWSAGLESGFVGWLCQALTVRDAHLSMPAKSSSEPAVFEMVSFLNAYFAKARLRLALAICMKMDMCPLPRCYPTKSKPKSQDATVDDRSEAVRFSDTDEHDLICDIKREMGMLSE